VLRETAADLRTAGRDNSFGYGLVQALDAWHHCQEADLGGLPRRYGQAQTLRANLYPFKTKGMK
jgi:hypothetical protein